MTERNVVSQRQKALFIVDEAERGKERARHPGKELKTPRRVCEDIKFHVCIGRACKREKCKEI
jgi:hypothetical protein